VTVPDWSTTDAYREEHTRLVSAGEHVARAVAELTHAQSAVGDHATAVALKEQIETLQLTQAHLAAAAERAYSLGQLAARRARQAAFEQQVNQASRPDAAG
jgi:ribosomal protein L18